MNKRWNIFLLVFVACVVGVIVYIKRDELGTFVQTIQSVRMLPFILAVGCLFGRYFSHAFAYKAVFHCVDEDVPYFHVIPLVFSVTFANDCAPTVGMAGSALIAAWSHKQGLNMGKSVSIVLLEKVGFFGGFAIIMFIGFIILGVTGQMTWYLIAGGIAVFVVIFLFGFVLVLGYNHVDTERRLFAWVERTFNHLRKIVRKGPMEPWTDRVTASFHEAALMSIRKPKAIAIMLARMSLLHAFDCLCFICVGFAFDFTYIPFLIGSYVAGFIIATFIPQTIGAVEILIALILSSYGATAAASAAIALCYRGLIFWIPFLIGAICINITGAMHNLNLGAANMETDVVKAAEAAVRGEDAAAGKDETAATLQAEPVPVTESRSGSQDASDAQNYTETIPKQMKE